jgi:hypothetical protein
VKILMVTEPMWEAAPEPIAARRKLATTTRRETVNGNPESLQTKDGEAVEVPLPISMHTGQILMLTKMFTASDLRLRVRR